MLVVCGLRDLPSLTGGFTHFELPPSPSTRSRRQPVSIEASKDKKKFNAQKKRTPAKASPAPGDPQAEKKIAIVPPRIDSNSNIPVRRQQRFLQVKKEAEAAAKRVPYKQTFRKAKIDPEQRAEEEKREAEYEAARRQAARKSPLATLQNLYGTSGKEHPPVILVDGYNVLFKFLEFLQVNHISHPVGEAVAFEDRRQAFETAMNGYSHRRGVKVVIAYDAMNRPADPVYVDIRTSSRTTLRGGVDVVFCSNQSADSWLIHEVDRLQKEGKAPQIMLATDDNEVCSGSFSRGIFPLPSQYLVTEMIYAEREEAEGSLRTGLGLTRKYGIYRYRQNEQGTLTRSQLVTEGLLALRAKKKAQERIQRHMQPPLESDRQS